MAELRSAMPQCSLSSVAFPVQCAPNRSSSSSWERLADSEQGLRRFRSSSSEKRIKTRIPAVVATTAMSESEIGTKKLLKLPGTLKVRNKDNNIVFVAGATGKVGSRTVKELLKLGIQVRAGVRSRDKAQTILEEAISSANGNANPLSKMLSFFGFKQQDQLEFVDCDLEKPEDLELALGNAGVVICTIGASEKEVLDVTGPYRIDYKATKNLIVAAKNAKVKHFVLVTSLGTTKFGWPAAALNLFWGVLIWKAKAEKALVESGIVYTIVRPGGMERPTDAYKETHNLRLGAKDSFVGGQISRLQVAELLACITNNLGLAENKILEVIAETSAPRRPIIELLGEFQSQDGEEEAEKESTAPAAKKRNKDEKLAEEDRKAQELKREKEKAIEAKRAEEKEVEAKKTQELKQKFRKELASLKKQEETAVAEAEKLQKKRMELVTRAQAAASAAAKAEAIAKAMLIASKEGRLLSEEDKRKIAFSLNEGTKKDPTTAKPFEKQESSSKVSSPEAVTKKDPKKSKSSNSKAVKTAVTDDVSPRSDAKKQAQKPETATETEAKAAVVKVTSAKSVKDKEEVSTEKKTLEPAEVKAISAESVKDKKEVSTEKKTLEPAEVKAISAESVKDKEEVSTEIKPLEAPAVEKDPGKETTTSLEVAEDVPPKGEQRNKPFRWFWQQSEPEVIEETDTRPLQEDVSVPEAPSKPLSPYFRYPDLKPPSSPTPTPPSSAVKPQQTSVEDEIEEPSSDSNGSTSKSLSPDDNGISNLKPPASPTPESPEVPSGAMEASSGTPPKTDNGYSLAVKEREQAALAKAKAAAVFVWPWKNPVSQAEEAKKTEAEEKEKVVVEEEKQVVKPVDVVEKPTNSRPLSPYWRYPDLKPPTTPSPRPPMKNLVTSISESDPSVEAPPESETVAMVSEALPEVKDEASFAKAIKEREQEALAKAKAALAWPWKVNVGSAKTEDTSTETENITEAPSASSSISSDLLTGTLDSSPLSPYARYEDLKPPSSPTPTPPTTSTASEESKAL